MAYYLVVSNNQTPVLLYNSNASNISPSSPLLSKQNSTPQICPEKKILPSSGPTVPGSFTVDPNGKLLFGNPNGTLLSADPKGTLLSVDHKRALLSADPKGTAFPYVDPKGSKQSLADLNGNILTLISSTPVKITDKSTTRDPKENTLSHANPTRDTHSVDLKEKVSTVPVQLTGKLLPHVNPIIKFPKTKSLPLLIPKGPLPLMPGTGTTGKRKITSPNDLEDKITGNIKTVITKTTPENKMVHFILTPPPEKKMKADEPVVKEEPKLASPELLESLKETLPTKFPYKITGLEGQSPDSLKAEIRISLRSEKDATLWLEEYKRISKTDWRVNQTYPPEGCRVLFKKRFHCYRSKNYVKDTDKNPRCKYTNCQARLMITIKNTKVKRPKDKLLRNFPAKIHLQHEHNHPIDDAALVRRPIDVTVKEKLRRLFDVGHSQTSAHKTFKFDLQLQHGKDYRKISADSTMCPSLRDSATQYKLRYIKLHGKEKSKHYGENGLWMIEFLPEFIKKYNEASGEKSATMIQDGKDVAVAICSPFMKKIHQHLPNSGESCMIWSSGRMYRYNIRVFIVLTSSAAGPLPLGMLLVTSQSVVFLKKVLEEYKSLLGHWAFHKRGDKGPNIIITNDSANEKNSLKGTYYNSKYYLNVEHVLQEFWRFVIDEKQGVTDSSDRVEIFRVFKSLTEWPVESTFVNQLRNALGFSVLIKYPSVANHLKEHLIPRVSEWAMSSRPQSLKALNNCGDIMMTLLYRTYTFGLVPLFDFLVYHLEGYFRERVSARLEDRLDNFTLANCRISENKQPTLTCEKISDDVYRVLDSESGILNEVHMCVRICTCQIGLTGCQCRHQSAVISDFNLNPVQRILRVNDRVKKVLHLILHGGDDDTPSQLNTEDTEAVAAIMKDVGEAVTEEIEDFGEAVTEEAADFDEGVTEETVDFDDSVTEEAVDFDEAVTEEAADLDVSVTEESVNIGEGVTEEAVNFGEAVTEESREFDKVVMEEVADCDDAITEDSAVFDVGIKEETTIYNEGISAFDEKNTEETKVNNETPVLERALMIKTAPLEPANKIISGDTKDKKENVERRIEMCERRFQCVQERLFERLRLNPEFYVPTMEKFLDHFEEASKTDVTMVYALASFNQFNGNVEVMMEDFLKER